MSVERALAAADDRARDDEDMDSYKHLGLHWQSTFQPPAALQDLRQPHWPGTPGKVAVSTAT